MADIDNQADALAQLIADYREGSIARPDAAHVMRWVGQFDEHVRVPILAELHHVFGTTYLSRVKALSFLRDVVKSNKLTGGSPSVFWRDANLLDIQLAGNSQSEVLELLDETLQAEIGVGRCDTGKGQSVFVYLDDGMFTGNRIRRDLEAWIKDAPAEVRLHVIVFVLHAGTYYARDQLKKAIRVAGKSIKITWWRMLELEDRKSESDNCDVLRPTALPAI